MNFQPQSNLTSRDRKLTLAVIDGKQPKSSTGLLDARLFTGDNSMHVKMDPGSCLWFFQYDNKGNLPEALKARFTSFGAAKKYAETYFRTRNVEIKEVTDE